MLASGIATCACMHMYLLLATSRGGARAVLGALRGEQTWRQLVRGFMLSLWLVLVGEGPDSAIWALAWASAHGGK